MHVLVLLQGKNITTREIFEGGNVDDDNQKRKEQIKIEGQPAARNLRERFEKGLSVIENDEDEDGEPRKVDDVFRNAGMYYVTFSLHNLPTKMSPVDFFIFRQAYYLSCLLNSIFTSLWYYLIFERAFF